MSYPETLPADIASSVRRALSEDIGSGDLTASLIPETLTTQAKVICREPATLCGIPWFNETFQQLDKDIEIHWLYKDGDQIKADEVVCTLSGPSRPILTGERTALNYLQLLSATATVSRAYSTALDSTETQLLDTRKTIPGLRTAQKYAVACGGGKNHRMGLYDAILIKENHIREAGSVSAAIAKAKRLHGKIEVEVETLEQLQEAIQAGADIVMLDNFSLPMMQEAVALNKGQLKLEASGNVELESIQAIAATGVDYISVGALTKHVRAIDFSMRITT